MRVAIVLYNTFVEEEQNGWRGKGPNRVLLLQNAKGERWGTSQFGRTRDEWHAETKALVDPLWAELQNELQNLDRVILYVGSHGAERIILEILATIRQARFRSLTARKLTTCVNALSQALNFCNHNKNVPPHPNPLPPREREKKNRRFLSVQTLTISLYIL